MGRVAILDAALASQIAAGEVVERPASALKELLENALDAGARRCDVAIEGGGISLLSVTDDGCGMTREDAELAIQRHATSKLTAFEQLNDLPSYGFRGEALPSIASVSRLRLKTRPLDSDVGTELVVQGGARAEVREQGMAVGTQVEVRDLFYNVPARRKFLRSSGTESGHIGEVLDSAALANPGVTFTLSRDGRKSREWLRAASREERVRKVLAEDQLAVCTGERGPLKLEAYLSSPERARAGSAGLRLFCNERPIRDRALLSTIAQAFGSVLERGRYPRGVVYLNLPRELVDINVHPQKSEVRFADARAVNDAAYQVLGAALSQAFSLPPPARNRFSEPRTMAAAPTALAREGELSALPPPPVAPKLPPAVSRPEALLPRPAAPPPPPPASRQRDFFHISDAPPVPKYSVSNEPEPAAAGNQQERWGQLKFVAQIRATYLLCEGGKGLYVLDQHAAAERVTFHRLRAQYAAESVASQSLLFPLTVEVGEAQSELLDARAEDIKRLGFDVRVHSSTTVSVHTVPRLLQRASPERLIFDLVSELSRSGRAFSDAVDSALATAACHGSVRAGDTLSPTEAAQLLRDLDEVDFATYCPHGRPIVTFTPWTELERRVGRR